MGALENQSDQAWTSHQVSLLHEMNHVAGDALENQRRSLMKQRQNFNGIKGEVTSICKKISRELGATCPKINKKSKFNSLREEKKLKNRDMNCLSLLLKDRKHLTVHGRNLEADVLACQKARDCRKTKNRILFLQKFSRDGRRSLHPEVPLIAPPQKTPFSTVNFRLGGPEKFTGAQDPRHSLQKNGGLADHWYMDDGDILCHPI